MAFLVLRGLGSDSGRTPQVPTLVILSAILVLGSAFAYEVGRRVTGRQIDRARFSLGAVSILTHLGLLAGIYAFRKAPIEAGVVLALLGAFGGTFVRARAGDVAPRVP